MEVVGIPTSIPNDLLEANVSKVFGKLGVHVEGKDIQACHRLKDNNRTLLNIAIGKMFLRFFVSTKASNLWMRQN